MKYFDKLDIGILVFLSTSLIILVITIAYAAGATKEMNRYRKEAIEKDFAYYAVNSSGTTEFRWKDPVRSQDSVDKTSLVYRISL